jgi:ATP-binding cassette subfamily C protein LapB
LIDKLKRHLINQTIVVITHRASIIELVDRVIVIEGGKVAAQGPKSDFMKPKQAPAASENPPASQDGMQSSHDSGATNEVSRPVQPKQAPVKTPSASPVAVPVFTNSAVKPEQGLTATVEPYNNEPQNQINALNLSLVKELPTKPIKQRKVS